MALVFKIGTLALKTLSKPLADRFKTWVMSHPQHRRSVMRLAEAAHRFEIGVTRRAEGKEGSAFIGAMTEERSVELASKLVSEGFVFAFGAVLVLAEYERNRRQGLAKQRRDEADRAAAKAKAQEERDRLVSEALAWKAAIEGLGSRVEAVEAALRALQEKERGNRKQSGWGGFFSSKPLQVEFGT